MPPIHRPYKGRRRRCFAIPIAEILGKCFRQTELFFLEMPLAVLSLLVDSAFVLARFAGGCSGFSGFAHCTRRRQICRGRVDCEGVRGAGDAAGAAGAEAMSSDPSTSSTTELAPLRIFQCPTE